MKVILQVKSENIILVNVVRGYVTTNLLMKRSDS
jgi:hypothetical protein